MQHAESTDAFSAMLSALGSRNLALHIGTQRVCVCERVAVMERDECLSQIQLVAEHGQHVASVLATGDCTVFVIGCDLERNSAKRSLRPRCRERECGAEQIVQSKA